MKIHWQILKRPSVVIGAIVLFLILLFMLNKGGSASSGTTTVNAGPSDAQVAAQTQLAIAQISAGLQGQQIQMGYAASQDADQTQIALATIAAASDASTTAAQAAIAAQTVAAQTHGLDLQYQTAIANNNAQIAALQAQYGYGIATAAINAGLQETLSADQLKAFQTSTLVNGIQFLKHDKDEALQTIIGAVTGQGVNYHGIVLPPSSGNAGTTSTIVNVPTGVLTPVGGSLG